MVGDSGKMGGPQGKTLFSPLLPSLTESCHVCAQQEGDVLRGGLVQSVWTVPEVGREAGVGRQQECSPGLLLGAASVPRGGPLDIKGSFCPLPSGKAARPLAMTQAWA